MAPVPPYHPSPRRRRFGVSLALVLSGVFAGTLGALQLVPVRQATADIYHASTRVIAARSTDTLGARFSFCHRSGGTNCVVDGDTFWFGGTKIRIMDIDTPETHPARCAEEQQLGDRATSRLQDWLNAGPFSLESGDRDTDRYGRQLRAVTRDGQSVGTVLIGEGLARPWEGRRRPWC